MGDAVEPVRRDHHDIDDTAGMLVVAPAFCGGLHHVPGAVQIGVDDRVPAFDRKVDRGLRKLSAGAVDESVDAAMRCPDRVEQRVDRLRFPDVGDVRGGLQIPASQIGDEASSFGWLRPIMATWAPNRANSQTVARPMPPAPPDTTTT